MSHDWPQTLSRAQFDTAGKAIAAEPPLPPSDLPPARLTSGWTWREHPQVAGFGYLERKVVRWMDAPRVADDEDDAESGLHEADSAALPVSVRPSCTVNLSACLSPTFRVPVLYFTAHQSTGAPLSLASLITSSIFHTRSATPSYPFTTLLPASAAATEPHPAPFLSQGDHPTLGTPAWFLHPCETEVIVREVLEGREKPSAGWGRAWMETWFMVVGSVVDLRG